MGQLERRLQLLEQRLHALPDVCSGHRPGLPPAHRDYRAGLRAMSPDPAEQAAYDQEQDALEALPPCERCGWQPFAVRVVVPDTNDWGAA